MKLKTYIVASSLIFVPFLADVVSASDPQQAECNNYGNQVNFAVVGDANMNNCVQQQCVGAAGAGTAGASVGANAGKGGNVSGSASAGSGCHQTIGCGGQKTDFHAPDPAIFFSSGGC